MRKIKVGIVFGGKSAEHEVSLESAKNIINAINKEKYEVFLIGIGKKGQWYLDQDSHFLLNPKNADSNQNRHRETIHSNVLKNVRTTITLVPAISEGKMIEITDRQKRGVVDVIFPVLHGPYGEDGSLQGFLKLANIPYVGTGVLGSAVGMDKDVMKRLLRDSGIPIAKFLVFESSEKLKFEPLKKELGLPFFVKPANLGSSVGVSKVHNKKEFKRAIQTAFEFDTKILIEEFIDGREIECAVLGNENPMASIPGEVIPSHEFYSYDAKYIDEKGAALEIPAKLDKKIEERIRKLAVKTFKVLVCEGMGRVDFFLVGNKVFVNEINTIPGFTKISMFPKLWEESGISYTELIDRLIKLAIERFEKESKLKVSR